MSYIINSLNKKRPYCKEPAIRVKLYFCIQFCEIFDYGWRDAGGELRDTGCEIRVAGCELRDTGCELPVAGCGIRVASCGLRITGYGLRVAR